MFRRIIAASLTLALLLTSLAFSGTASAQRNTTAAPGTWQSAILIQNTGSGPADVSVEFYDKDGVLKKTYTPAQLLGGKSVTIIVPVDVADLTPGQYSAVVSSSQPVVASVQTSSLPSTGAPWTAFAYEGVSSQNVGTTLYFPGNYKNYFGFFSELVLQNAGTADTTVTVEFYNQDGALLGSAINLGTLAQNRALTFSMSDATPFASLPSGNTNGIFGAVVKSSNASVPLAGIVNVWRTTPTNMTASYNAFTTGSNTLYAPSLTNNYFGFASALTIQNVDTVDAAVTVVYSNGVNDTFTLKPSAARALYAPANANLPSGSTNGTFAAKVTSTGGKIVGQVGYSRPSELRGGLIAGDYANYNCPPTATAEVNVPNILSNYFGLFTNVTVQNTGTSATDITLTYEDGQSWTITGVAPNGVANFLHLNANGTTIKNPLGFRKSVSGTLSSSPAQPLVAVIQHNTDPSVSGYNAAKLPSDFLHVFTATPK